MNRLNPGRRTQIISAMVEGKSINAITRMTGASKNTVLKLLTDLGETCTAYQDEHLRNLNCRRVQVDEIWAFCHSKAKNVPEDKRGILGYGDVWTWTAIDADSKLIPCWHLGRRDGRAAYEFINDLASRLTHRIQLTRDGHRPYLEAVEAAFGSEIDYSMLIKMYGKEQDEIRYSPPVCIGCEVKKIQGDPDPEPISTSYVERQNLTMGMSMRRFTRLTNGFSKKLENHMHAVALHNMHYNFVRIHQTLRCTPAMAAGVTKTVWEIEDIVKLLH
jgi:IS1 family transposase